MDSHSTKALIEKAIEARNNAYCPYSGFAVGAALLCEDGEVFTGVNIENASFPVGLCAERSAVSAAVSSGKRCFTAIAVVGGRVGEDITGLCPPCGMCRQFLSELCSDDFKIILARSSDDHKVFTLSELLPYRFDK